MEEQEKKKRVRPDHDGKHRLAFDRNKKKILYQQNICGICGRPVDKTVKFPHPLSATVDHIIPIDRGGHPSDISNLQLAHFACNRAKSNKILEPVSDAKKDLTENKAANSNRILPLSRDWAQYRAKN